MLLIQGLLHFYNKHPQLDLFKKKALFMACIETFNIYGTTIHSSIFIPFNCKKIPSLSSKLLNNLIKKYDQL